MSDTGGLLRTTEGALFVRGNGGIVQVRVPAPIDANTTPLTGKGWAMELKPGWHVVPEGRAGDFAVRQRSEP